MDPGTTTQVTTDFSAILSDFLPIVGSVWLVTEVIGRIIPKVEKSLIALVLGPVAGVGAQYVGWVNAGDGGKGFVAAIMLGLFATVAANVGHQTIVKPITSPKKKD